MRKLSREDLCAMLGIDVEDFKSKHRRKQVPSAHYDPSTVGREGKGFSPLEALLAFLTFEIHGGLEVSLERASLISSSGWLINKRLREVAETSLAIYNGKIPKTEILFGRVEYVARSPNVPLQVHPVLGTLSEIAAEYPTPSRIVLGSVSRAAAKMRAQAARHKIDLGDFWDA